MIRVLIVEDDADIARLHWAFVERTPGFKVVGRAESVAVAEAMVTALHPDLLLLDVYLPDGRGLDVLRALRARGSHVDSILVTAANDLGNVQDALAAGAVDYLVKPVEPARLQVALGRARERADARRQATLGQARLDALFGAPPSAPPGLDAETLARVRAALMDGAARTAAEVGAAVQLSRVTAWRYLEHLVEGGELVMDTERAPVGRPTKRYRRA
ncbi:response regulator [Deinococcus maricopensis]|uniref:Transcriptional regulatory protein n=1 Tax=Deinococcus maricopensis (strain DSM 21211 / LMG 22137 / NRRL B-23946 / LB-34) TaxID=709986 RepID=E8U7M8_DEIML|nr:response regulator [Deinococcus maricopensis]ADV67067.1 response regulator receiver and unknown domain protein [Deinococcus maricopensis DSM 21211]